MKSVTLAYANFLSDALGSAGIGRDRLDTDLADRFRSAHARVEELGASGALGFLSLPEDSEMHRTVQEIADSFGQWFEAIVVVGIGGSSLGARAVADALLGPRWNLRSEEKREHYPRLFFLENADPESFQELLGIIDPRRTLFNVVSKSGSTAETMSQFLAIEEILAEELDEDKLKGHLLFTTDPESGGLRRLAHELGVPALAVPPQVGGRFSVLSPVGLLPAAVTGIDLSALMDGAAAMVDRCRSSTLTENPAGVLATLLHAADTELGRPIHVMMPYGDRMRTMGLWFQQLWAESLGKAVDREGRTVESGPTPMAALGAVDQHSLLQLLMEGPQDKVVVFLRNRSPRAQVQIPRRHAEIESFGYLGGHELGELLEVERRATAEALRRAGRPSMTLQLERLDAAAIGELLMLLQIATVYAGALYGVDPLDQPGVELGKDLTSGLFSREGYEAPSLADEDAGGARV